MLRAQHFMHEGGETRTAEQVLKSAVLTAVKQMTEAAGAAAVQAGKEEGQQ